MCLIGNGKAGLESKKGWGTRHSDDTSLLNWLDDHSPLSVYTVGWQDMVLYGLLRHWAICYYYYYYYHHYYNN